MASRFRAATGTTAARTLDVRPDDSDARDYIFVPSLQLLPHCHVFQALGDLVVRDQGSEGACAGFALAAVIDASLSRRPDPRNHAGVSARMLYEMGRRYDEWQGDNYDGTSLRGVMKGWHKNGVAAETDWPWTPGIGGSFTTERAAAARWRPLGTYYRIIDSDISHMQAAIYEGDAILVSAWIHDGWRADQLLAARESDDLQMPRIRPGAGPPGLHAFAIIGYGREGFLVQNSWGRGWGKDGRAVLSYEDWMKNRQDAWVARPGPPSFDFAGRPQIFNDAFAGGSGYPTRVEARGGQGLGLSDRTVASIINTGDRGKLSSDGVLTTTVADLRSMASSVRTTTPFHGERHVVLYAHGGVTDEAVGARTAGRLWSLCDDLGLKSFYFVWETGIGESILGRLQSTDDALGPTVSGPPSRVAPATMVQDALKLVGRAFAPLVRIGWEEMKGRAQGAAQAKGGAGEFLCELSKAMMQSTRPEPFRIHLIGYSAGAIYLAHLLDCAILQVVRSSSNRIRLGTINLLAPAISVADARRLFQGAVTDGARVDVHTLSPEHEAKDAIGIYPSSILTYVADLIESPEERTPILGLRRDAEAMRGELGWPHVIPASRSQRHGDFDKDAYEVTEILGKLSRGELPAKRSRKR